MKRTLAWIVLSSLIFALIGLSYGSDMIDGEQAQLELTSPVAGGPDGSSDSHPLHDNTEHDVEVREDGQEGDTDHQQAVRLTATQMVLAEIKIAPLIPTVRRYEVIAPGEVKANGYTSYIVSPRVDSVVVRRHAALGEHVDQGQALITLFSDVVAEAQATYHLAYAESQRVSQLGRIAVGDGRYLSSRAALGAAYGRLQAFGLSEVAIEALRSELSSLGEYTLNAAISGAVLSDDFWQGQRVESGDALMELADEQELWVEALLAPNMRLQLSAGMPARVKVASDLFDAKVTQEAHTIDPRTRTRVVRLIVRNDDHLLHPGMFADVVFSFATDEPVLAVPEAALMRRADGDWTVFIETEPGEVSAEEVRLGQSLGAWREIHGVPPGTRIVIEGAFFVASQIAKSGFDPHGH